MITRKEVLMRPKNLSNLVASTLLLVCVALGTLAPATASAHGIWAHVHVTGWAIENLEHEELEDFFSDPEVKNAALFGAAFTDSGYWPQGGEHQQAARAYSEHTHWEPFIESAIRWLIANDPPPWQSQESKKRVAFIMGAAAHGLQDELFDTLFLPQIAMHDGAGQDEADPASDGFLGLDDHVRFTPQEYIPLEMLLDIYASADLGHEISEETIRAGVDFMTAVYLNPRASQQLSLQGERYKEEVAWTRAYYLDPAIPGSLRAEIMPTRAYIELIWERLHDRHTYQDLLIHTYPDPGRISRSNLPDTPDSWVSFVFGVGVKHGNFQTRLADEELDITQATGEVQASSSGTRWGGEGGWGRVITLEPQGVMRPGMWHIASIRAKPDAADADEGNRAILDHTMIPQDIEQATWEHRFLAACSPDDPAPCQDNEPPEPLPIDPPPSNDPQDMGGEVQEMGVLAEEPDMAIAEPDSGSSSDMTSVGEISEEDTPPTSMDRTEESGCAVATRSNAPGFASFLLALSGLFSMRRRRRKTPLDQNV